MEEFCLKNGSTYLRNRSSFLLLCSLAVVFKEKRSQVDQLLIEKWQHLPLI